MTTTDKIFLIASQTLIVLLVVGKLFYWLIGELQTWVALLPVGYIGFPGLILMGVLAYKVWHGHSPYPDRVFGMDPKVIVRAIAAALCIATPFLKNHFSLLEDKILIVLGGVAVRSSGAASYASRLATSWNFSDGWGARIKVLPFIISAVCLFHPLFGPHFTVGTPTENYVIGYLIAWTFGMGAMAPVLFIVLIVTLYAAVFHLLRGLASRGALAVVGAAFAVYLLLVDGIGLGGK